MLTDSAVRSPAILRGGGPKRNLALDCLDARSHVLCRDLFDRLGPDALHLYCELALRSIPLGLERGGYGEQRAEEMRVLLRAALEG